MTSRVAVLLAAGGETWEAAALRLLENGQMVVIKRCVDVHDLIASAGTGQADVAVVAGELGGLDADAVMRLLRHDVRCVAVGGSARAARPDRRAGARAARRDRQAARSRLVRRHP